MDGDSKVDDFGHVAYCGTGKATDVNFAARPAIQEQKSNPCMFKLV